MTVRSHQRRKSGCDGRTVRDPLVQSALKLIDQAAGLLKKGVVVGAGGSAEVRHRMKLRASTLVGRAAEQLQDAIGQGAAALRKKIRKL